MANSNAPTGFVYAGRLEGGAPTAGQSTRYILSSDNTAIYQGDPVELSSGYVTQMAPGTNPTVGIFIGCTYYSTAQQKPIQSPWWPGSGATGDVTAYVISDPSAIFSVQATSGPITFASLGLNVQFALGTGNTVTGQSGATIASPATTSTLPFRIVGFQSFGPGSDISSAYNRVLVTFNNQIFKNLDPTTS